MDHGFPCQDCGLRSYPTAAGLHQHQARYCATTKTTANTVAKNAHGGAEESQKGTGKGVEEEDEMNKVVVDVKFSEDFMLEGGRGRAAYRVAATAPMQRVLEAVGTFLWRPLTRALQVAAKVRLEPGRLLLRAAGDSGAEEVPGEAAALLYRDNGVIVYRRAEA
jgi:hypothetical protein